MLRVATTYGRVHVLLNGLHSMPRSRIDTDGACDDVTVVGVCTAGRRSPERSTSRECIFVSFF
jgi:hypothetical protein